MESEEVLEMLEAVGAITTDSHFVYASGKHGPGYINMDLLFPHIAALTDLCSALTDYVDHSDDASYPDVIIGAATGGIPLAVLAAREFDYDVNCIWADKVGKDDNGAIFAIERLGYAELLEGANVLVVEDLLNTGGTVKKIIALVRKYGGNVVCISAICNRGQQTAESLKVPKLVELSTFSLQTFEPSECPQCANQVPVVTDVGHGAAYKDEHPDYPGGYTLISP